MAPKAQPADESQIGHSFLVGRVEVWTPDEFRVGVRGGFAAIIDGKLRVADPEDLFVTAEGFEMGSWFYFYAFASGPSGIAVEADDTPPDLARRLHSKDPSRLYLASCYTYKERRGSIRPFRRVGHRTQYFGSGSPAWSHSGTNAKRYSLAHAVPPGVTACDMSGTVSGGPGESAMISGPLWSTSIHQIGRDSRCTDFTGSLFDDREIEVSHSDYRMSSDGYVTGYED